MPPRHLLSGVPVSQQPQSLPQCKLHRRHMVTHTFQLSRPCRCCCCFMILGKTAATAVHDDTAVTATTGTHARMTQGLLAYTPE
jgi:predicted Zn-dependent protease